VAICDEVDAHATRRPAPPAAAPPPRRSTKGGSGSGTEDAGDSARQQQQQQQPGKEHKHAQAQKGQAKRLRLLSFTKIRQFGDVGLSRRCS
jgi:hypothetical protein